MPMDESVTNLTAAPMAHVFVIAGLLFLAIAVVGRVSGKFNAGKTGRIAAGGLGTVFLVVGLLMYAHTSGPPPKDTSGAGASSPPAGPVAGLPDPTPAHRPPPSGFRVIEA